MLAGQPKLNASTRLSAPSTRPPRNPIRASFFDGANRGLAGGLRLDPGADPRPPVGYCYRDGQDVAEALIKAGLVRARPRYSAGRCCDQRRQVLRRPVEAKVFSPIPARALGLVRQASTWTLTGHLQAIERYFWP